MRFSLLPLSFFALTACLSCAADAATLRVLLTGVRSATGELQIDVHDADKKRRVRRRVAATAGSVIVPIVDLAPGAYAVQVYHDENANGRLDTGGLLGLPVEGYGFSKDATVRFGPPSFEAMRVDVSGDASVTAPIRLRYPRGAK